MTVSSAPGKVYLFGEHAVVFGEPAVPCAIERRATVTVEPREDDHVRVHAGDLSIDGFTVEYDGALDGRPDVAVPQRLVDAAMGYVDASLAQAMEAVGIEEMGFDLTIESEIPLGAGLGSSAAVTVATIDAATRALDTALDVREIADRAYRAEAEVQHGQASRADTFCSAMGGVVRVEGDDCRTLETPDLPLVIGFDGGAGDTGELVSKVRALKEEYQFADETIGAIGNLVREGEASLRSDDLDGVGRLMDFNHGLLTALGVSSASLDEMVWAARGAGALGAKLTGAGGGGCIVALDASDASLTALETTPVCEEVFRADLARSGLRTGTEA